MGTKNENSHVFYALAAGNATFVVLGLVFLPCINQDAIIWYWIALLAGGNLSSGTVIAFYRGDSRPKPNYKEVAGMGLLYFGLFFSIEATIIAVAIGHGWVLLIPAFVVLVTAYSQKSAKKKGFDILYSCMIAYAVSASIVCIIAGYTFSLVSVPYLAGVIAAALVCERVGIVDRQVPADGDS